MKAIHPIDLGAWPPAMYVTNDKRAYNRFMRQMQKGDFKPFPPHNGGSCQRLEREDECRFVIAIGSQDSPIELAATIAHEATHAMRWLLEYVGEEHPGTETQSYLVEHIVRCSLEALQG